MSGLLAFDYLVALALLGRHQVAPRVNGSGLSQLGSPGRRIDKSLCQFGGAQEAADRIERLADGRLKS